MPLISFIVPVYNVEKYLHQCIDSMVHQLNNCELILVDDGSTDSSGRICDEYAAKYPSIKVFHTENKGPSHARNFGVNAAQGVYIVFVDSDDYINDDFVRKFEEANFTAEIIFYPMKKLFPNGQLVPMGDGMSAEILHNGSVSTVLAHIASCPKFPASPCGRLIRRSFLMKYGIHFAFNRITEDYDWTYQLLQYATSYDYFEAGIYIYRQIPQSRSSGQSVKGLEDQLVILTHWEKKLVDDSFRQYLNSFLAYEYAMIFPCYGSLTKKEKAFCISEMRRCAYLLRYGKSRKLKLIRMFCIFFGVGMTSWILHRYIKVRNIRYRKR